MTNEGVKGDFMERFDPQVKGNGPRAAMPGNRIVTEPVLRKTGVPMAGAHPTTKTAMKMLKKPSLLAMILAVMVLTGIGYCVFANSIGSQVNGTYQAVFLPSGEVYFGKIQVINGSFIKMTNVYYIQNKDSSTASTSSIGLTQLVKAPHGPKDEIILNRSQVLYFENLKDDSQAAKLMSGDKINR